MRERIRVLLIVCSFFLAAPPAHGWNSDQRAVMTGGLYGAIAGTLVGLITLPVSQSGRNVFVGTSVGLYLGMVAGLYHIHHRDDPSNPLRYDASSRELVPEEQPEAPLSVLPPGPPPATLRLDVPVLTF